MSKIKSTSDSGGILKQEEKTKRRTFTPKDDSGLVDVIYEAFQLPQFHGIVGFKLKKAELEAFTTKKRYTHEEVIEGLRQTLLGSTGDKNV